MQRRLQARNELGLLVLGVIVGIVLTLAVGMFVIAANGPQAWGPCLY